MIPDIAQPDGIRTNPSFSRTGGESDRTLPLCVCACPSHCIHSSKKRRSPHENRRAPRPLFHLMNALVQHDNSINCVNYCQVGGVSTKPIKRISESPPQKTRVIVFITRVIIFITRVHFFITRVHFFITRVHNFTTRVHFFTTRVHFFTTRVHFFITRVHFFITRVHFFTTRVHFFTTRVHFFITRVHFF